jgi:hypothetical protein
MGAFDERGNKVRLGFSEDHSGDLTKGKIKHGKDSLTLGNDERSVRPLDKVSTRKKRRYSDPDCA